MATYDKPHQYGTGVRYLFVNGKLAIEDGKHTKGMARQSATAQERLGPRSARAGTIK